ncbi:MAG: hypothetical protein GX580_02855 [Candidatus Hydrogenedens sp.]|nr:hypothetical protein [Candidatus Hydrogenedentota bacterium]NLF56558.1 hypothetical protein [Candidatus Hydrogenedens sp.]
MAHNRAFVERQRDIRLEVLNRLYDQRSANAKPPSPDFVWERELLRTDCAPDEVRFALGYLAETGEIAADGCKYRITAAGIRAVERLLLDHEGD